MLTKHYRAERRPQYFEHACKAINEIVTVFLAITCNGSLYGWCTRCGETMRADSNGR